MYSSFTDYDLYFGNGQNIPVHNILNCIGRQSVLAEQKISADKTYRQTNCNPVSPKMYVAD
jgi:hypothetical protein